MIVTQPGTPAQSGADLSPQPAVQVQDAFGNNIGSAGRTITAVLVSPPAGAALGGDATKQTDAGGAAAFTDLRISGPAQTYTIRFTSGGLTAATSAQVTITAGSVSAGRSTVDANPGSVASGAPATITVTARDASGNPVSGATVVLSATGTGNTLTQPAGATDASGVATGTFSSTTSVRTPSRPRSTARP